MEKNKTFFQFLVSSLGYQGFFVADKKFKEIDAEVERLIDLYNDLTNFKKD